MKNFIDDKIQPRFNAINNAILTSKSALTNVSERTSKILEIHEKSVEVYLKRKGLSDLNVEKKNFFE